MSFFLASPLVIAHTLTLLAPGHGPRPRLSRAARREEWARVLVALQQRHQLQCVPALTAHTRHWLKLARVAVALVWMRVCVCVSSSDMLLQVSIFLGIPIMR